MEIENGRLAPLISQGSGQNAPVENRPQQRENVSNPSNNQTNNTADRVSLTGEAQQLRELGSQIASESVVDSKRVAEIRSTFDSGTFSVDSHAIAGKLISLEQALTDAR